VIQQEAATVERKRTQSRTCGHLQAEQHCLAGLGGNRQDSRSGDLLNNSRSRGETGSLTLASPALPRRFSTPTS
jgi:hypothetical protein